MKTAILAVLRYAIAIAVACVVAGLAAAPFLKPGDFSVPFQMIFVGAMSGFYILTYTPIVIITEIAARRVRGHHILPLWAIPIFGMCFPVLGFAIFSRTWWPEEPADMDARHVVTFLLLAAFALCIALLIMKLRNKTPANNTPEGICQPADGLSKPSA